ncbi:MAG TPA: plastocyanin/azurin family copper-binding protein, partial [Thermoleophilaceae bacterium]|nr:plastocyanin/azurin family copper-binding protein [Thermoleophilaceae bacterium]
VRNADMPTMHSATADDGSFDTGIYDAGESRSETFKQAGTFSYFCTPHPFMKASVTVRASGAGGESGSGSEGEGSPAGGTAGGAGTSAAGSDAGSGEALPATGRDSGSLLMLGLLMLALGVAVQRRSREQAARPAGRIGG